MNRQRPNAGPATADNPEDQARGGDTPPTGLPVDGAASPAEAPASPWAAPPDIEQARRELAAERKKAKAKRDQVWRDMHILAQEHAALLGMLVKLHGEDEGIRQFELAHIKQPDLLAEAIALHNNYQCLTPNGLLKFKLKHLNNMSNPSVVRAALARISKATVSDEIVNAIAEDMRAARMALN